MGCGPRARLMWNAAVQCAGARGPRGTKGTASLGQPRGKERKLAGSPIEGEGQLSRCRGPAVAMSRCVSAAERKGRGEARGVEGEHHAALVPGGSGGTCVSGCRPRTCLVPRTESARHEPEGGPARLRVRQVLRRGPGGQNSIAPGGASSCPRGLPRL